MEWYGDGSEPLHKWPNIRLRNSAVVGDRCIMRAAVLVSVNETKRAQSAREYERWP